MNKILIISPNLETTKCGVSDYAIELGRMFEVCNNEVTYLAISDIYIDTLIVNKNVYRIPYRFTNKKKIKLSLSYISLIEPDAIYFNFVSYGYHIKGFPHYLIPLINKINHNSNFFIIAHELWMGNFKRESFKSKFIGFLQKIIILRLLKLKQINKIFTTTEISKNILKSNGISSSVISVFNNIPINAESGITKKDIDNYTFMLFGSIAFQIDEDEFIKFLHTCFFDLKKSVTIIWAGVHRGQMREWDILKCKLSTSPIKFIDYSIVDASIISSLMLNADYGLTSYMPDFWSKSGSIAAMLAHGLPVFSISKTVQLDKFLDNLVLHPRIINIANIPKDFNLNDFQKESPIKQYNEIIFKKIVDEKHFD